MRTLWLCFALVLAVAFVGVQAGFAADSIPAGQKIFLDSKCNSCHSLKAAKIEKKQTETAEAEEAAPSGTPAKKPPDLSGVGLKHTAAWMEGWLMKKELMDGKKHKKMFRGSPGDLKTLTTWLSTMKTKPEGEKAEAVKAEPAKTEAAKTEGGEPGK